MTKLLFGIAVGIVVAGCGPEFAPASLVEKTRVLGARIEVEGAPDRASPMPGETANVTFLVTSPGVEPPLSWTFVACAGTASCADAPLARFDGTTSPPRISIPVPSDATASVTIAGQICAGVDSVPTIDPQNGLPACTGPRGTAVSLALPLQLGADANHNPVADRAFTFGGAAWPARAAGDDPCALGPRVSAGSLDHAIRNTTDGVDRERYTVVIGDPPIATPTRERLQISQFTTAGRLKSQFAFVEANDDSPATTVDVTWDAPEADEIPASGTLVTFTFVVRDERGGADWTTRTLCVTP